MSEKIRNMRSLLKKLKTQEKRLEAICTDDCTEQYRISKKILTLLKREMGLHQGDVVAYVDGKKIKYGVVYDFGYPDVTPTVKVSELDKSLEVIDRHRIHAVPLDPKRVKLYMTAKKYEERRTGVKPLRKGQYVNGSAEHLMA